MENIIPAEFIHSKIYIIRGERVMLDRDLADLYGVHTKRLSEQVKRNIERFPKEFRFQLSKKEKDELVAICDHLEIIKYSSTAPYVFTEQGVAMLSAVLHSRTAIEVSIQIIKAFVEMRRIFTSNIKIHKKLTELESKYNQHDKEISVIFEAIKQLMEPPPEDNSKRIGFITNS